MSEEIEKALAEADFYSMPVIDSKYGVEKHLRVLAQAYRAKEAEVKQMREEYEKTVGEATSAYRKLLDQIEALKKSILISCKGPGDIFVVPDNANERDFEHFPNPCHPHRIMRQVEFDSSVAELEAKLKYSEEQRESWESACREAQER